MTEKKHETRDGIIGLILISIIVLVIYNLFFKKEGMKLLENSERYYVTQDNDASYIIDKQTGQSCFKARGDSTVHCKKEEWKEYNVGN